MWEKARTVWDKIINRIFAGDSPKDEKPPDILGGVGTGPPATEVPDALAATIVDTIISDRPVGSFVCTSDGRPDV
jgi:hypothetical protein